MSAVSMSHKIFCSCRGQELLLCRELEAKMLKKSRQEPDIVQFAEWLYIIGGTFTLINCSLYL